MSVREDGPFREWFHEDSTNVPKLVHLQYQAFQRSLSLEGNRI
jgi:hypothetical protein